MRFTNIFNKKAVIKKPVLIEKILSSLIVVLLFAVILVLISLSAIQDYIYDFSWDGIHSISDYLWEIKGYADDGITDEEMDMIIAGANRQAINGRPVIVRINGEEVVNLTNKYVSIVADRDTYTSGFIANDWLPEAYEELEEIAEYESRSADFYDYGYCPLISTGYYNPETKELILDDVELYLFSYFSGESTEKVIKRYDLVSSDMSIPEGFVRVGEEDSVYNAFGLFVVGDFKYPMSDCYESEDLKIEVVYDYQLLHDLVNFRMTVVIVVVTLAIIILSIVSGVIRYYKSKSIYDAFEYRRKTTNAMAHDLKTPLAIVSLSVANLKDSIARDEARVRYHADEIDDSVAYINSLIGNILEFSKSEDDSYKLSKTKVNVRSEIEKHISEIQNVIKANNLTVVITGESSQVTDIKLWNQAVNNLIDNAVKYASTNSSIEVLLEKNSVSITNSVDTEVTDADKLTEPFVKGDNSRGENSGSGLGLAIADNNLKRLGYKLSVSCRNKMFKVVIK